MIDIRNLRLEEDGDWMKAVADISSDFQRSDSQSTMWVAVKKENAEMLTTDVYNAFLLFPLYMAMYYKSDLHLHGKVSKELYKNVTTYLQSILCSFSPDLQRVNVIVDGYGEASGPHSIIGTGISGGVDCLSTIYVHHELEKDEEDKIRKRAAKEDFVPNFVNPFREPDFSTSRVERPRKPSGQEQV